MWQNTQKSKSRPVSACFYTPAPQGSPLSCVDMSNEINVLLTFVRNVRSNIQKREVLFKLNKVIGV